MMQITHHPRRHHPPRPRALVRVAVATLVAGAIVAACGSDGGTDVALSPQGEQGREIVRSNGCAACHGQNGEGSAGPSFVGLYGSTVELEDGETVVADEAYLFESIRDPGAKVVDGYGFPMPTNDLTDSEIESVIAFIRDLAEPAEDGS